VEYGWKYPLTTSIDTAGTASRKNSGRDRALPQFSPEVFLERLVCFIVADDQVSPNNLVFFHMLTCL
jgi:hypothetical protein